MMVISKGKEALLKFGINQGIAVCVCAVFLWMFYGAAQWIAAEVIEPTRDRFFSHMDRVETTLGEHTDEIRTLKRDSERHYDLTKQHTPLLEKTAASASKASDTLDRVDSVLREIRDAKAMPAVRAMSNASKEAADSSKQAGTVSIKPGG